MSAEMWFEVFAAFLSLLGLYYLCRMADDIHAIRKLLEKPEEKTDGGQSGIVMRNYPLK